IGSHSVATVSAPLTASAQKVQDALRALGLSSEVVESEQPTRTAAEAAKLVGCQVGQIAKSLVFKTAQTERAVLVITSGANTVNEFRVGMHVKEALGKAPAAFVRQVTGFAIGGIPPIAHATPIETFIDQDLLKYPEIWAPAGTPNALFRPAPADPVTTTGRPGHEGGRGEPAPEDRRRERNVDDRSGRRRPRLRPGRGAPGDRDRHREGARPGPVRRHAQADESRRAARRLGGDGGGAGTDR